MSSVYISHEGPHGEHFQLEITDSSQVERRILMFAEMTPGSNHTLVISKTGIGRNCCILYRQQQVRSDKIYYFSKSRTKDQKCIKSSCFRTWLKFCFKGREKMEQREPTRDPAAEGTEGRLRDLASKWFIDTQVPLIVNNGLFPTWFLGFITRKDAEEILREKELGCFLIRLSDKAIGYILSYKGRDRCRHFVISQTETGQFVVCGDTEEHNTVLELIEYYRTRPIEPFGEYLTSSCFEALDEELYDMIQVSPKEKPVALRAAKNIRKQQISTATGQKPTGPSKNNREQEEVPPLPRRSRHPDSGTSNDHDKVLYAQLRKQIPRESPRVQHFSQDCLPGANPGKAEKLTPKEQNNGRCSPPSGPETVYSELNLLESKSRSLPLLDRSTDGEQSYRLSAPPNTPPRLSPKPERQAARCTPQSEKTDLCIRANNSHSLDCISDTAVYHLAGWPGRQNPTSSDNRSLTPEQYSDSVYAEVASEALTFAHDSTYELLPDHVETAKAKPNSSTYEPVEDIRRNPNRSSWGLKNDKWKWFLPEAKRKW